MQIETTFTRDRIYARSILYRVHRSRIWIMFAAAAVVILCGAPFGAKDSVRGTFALVLGCAAAYYAATLPRRAARKMPQAWYAPQHFTFTAEGITVDAGEEHQEYPWAIVSGIELTRLAVLIKVGGNTLDLPREALTEEQLRTVHELRGAAHA